MSVRITYFVHGTTTDNLEHRSSGWNDVELSELGIQQSKELREITAGEDYDVVFSSDLRRAVESARLAFEDRAPLLQDERLRECNYGDLNGGDSDRVEPMQERMLTERFENGESYEDVKTRISGFLEMLNRDYDGKHVAIVAHKAPQLALDVLVQGKTWEQAFAEDWRKTKSWQPGWKYELS